MSSNVALKKTDRGWKFIDESELETFVWDNLEEILALKPLQRQSYLQGERCDILAIGEHNQLAIIELKNTEDRYVINQLTRYYENLLEEQPFKDRIDYKRDVRLLAICPNFHRHNLTDTKHSKLNFELFTFLIKSEQGNFYFCLDRINAQCQNKMIKINYKEVNLLNQENHNLPEPPRLLLDWFGCLTDNEIKNLTTIRNKILGFDCRLEEIINNKSIIYASRYGKEKFRQCAEFSFDKKSKKILLFLWLVIPERKNRTITRMQIDTVQEYLAYWRFIPFKEGFISTDALKEINIKYISYCVPENNINNLMAGRYMVIATEDIVNEALKTWLERSS